MENIRWELRLGEIQDYNMDLLRNETRPRFTVVVSDDIKQFIEQFANVKISPNVDRLYIINDLQFTIHPYIEQPDYDDEKDYKQSQDLPFIS